MTGPVKIRVDLSTGEIEVEVDATHIESVFDRLDAFIPRLSDAYARHTSGAATTSAGAQAIQATPTTQQSVDATSLTTTEQKTEPRRTTKGSKGKEVYTTVDLGLTEAQRQAMRDFYATKQPKSQNEQVAVLMDWLQREGNRPTATWNDIFTAFRTVGEKSPAKISSVLGNMVGLSWVKNAGAGKYTLIHVGEDYVKFELPKSKSTK